VIALPKHEGHNFIDRVCLGRSFPRLHRALDKPVFFLGKYHRELFHDLTTAYFIAHQTYPNDPRAVESARLHIYYDEFCSRDPEYRRYLEKMAKSDKQRRKANRSKRRRKKKKDDDFESLIRFIKFVLRLKSGRFHD